MYILPPPEGIQQRRILGQMRQHPQFNLRIVRRQQPAAGIGHKSPPHLPPLFRPHRNVLQIGVAAADAPGGRTGLMVGGMNAPRNPVHHFRQRVHIGGLQLRHLPIFQDAVHHRMQPLEHFQRVGVGGEARFGAPRFGQPQLSEQQITQLLGRIDVDRMPDVPVQIGLNLRQLFVQIPRHFVQDASIQPDAGLLHLHQHRHQGQLHIGQQRRQLIPRQLRLQAPAQPQRAVGIGGGVGRPVGNGNLIKGFLIAPLADEVGDFRHLLPQHFQGDGFEAQAAAPQQVGGNHRIVVNDAVGGDAVLAQQRQVVVGVVGAPTDARRSEQRAHRRQRFLQGHLRPVRVAHRYIPGRPAVNGETQTRQFRRHRIRAAGFRVKGKGAGRRNGRHHSG